MIRFVALLACLALLACTPRPVPEVPQRLAVATEPLPAMKVFGQYAAGRPQRSNAEMARDIMELEFQMESGRVLDRLTRFEQPVTVLLTGEVPPTAPGDLGRLLRRLRAEAGIRIEAVSHGPAAITVEFLPRTRLQALVPQAACFVVPGVSSFSEYRRARRSERVDWVQLSTRERVAVFVPSDTAPQEVRDCLHEEIAQALGPLNDLYSLSDSVFNDDNFHTVLTGFDMLVLRVHYAPEMSDGMSKEAFAAALPGVLARLNPSGQRTAPPPLGPTPRDWVEAVETALGPGSSSATRRAAAQRAVAIAQSQGWSDARMAFSYFALGRLSLADEVEIAVTSLAEAARIYRGLPDAEIHAAHIDMQMAAFALSAGQPDQAIRLADHAIPVVTRAENAALLASLMMIKAEALEMTGQSAQAQALRLDSLGWARYGFGAEDQVRARMSEIAVLSPGPGRG